MALIIALTIPFLFLSLALRDIEIINGLRPAE